jgi:hypothetical protein
MVVSRVIPRRWGEKEPHAEGDDRPLGGVTRWVGRSIWDGCDDGRDRDDRMSLLHPMRARVGITPTHVHHGTAWLRRGRRLFGPLKLALLTSLPGAKLGANSASHQATSGHAQPGSPQLNGTQGDTGPQLATVRSCMACKRPGVRVPLAPRFPRSTAYLMLGNHL